MLRRTTPPPSVPARCAAIRRLKVVHQLTPTLQARWPCEYRGVTAPYTSLLVTTEGVVLLEQHRARLGPRWRSELDAFARTATPGAWVVRVDSGTFRVEPRPGSRLYDGIATRARVSPVADLRGELPKQASPSPWDDVREPGLATLLTDATGTEVYESCSAAVLGWDGARLVSPPVDRPRVASTAVQLLLAHHAHRCAPLAPDGPLLLVNAVVLTCLPLGSTFPVELRQRLHALLLATASRM